MKKIVVLSLLVLISCQLFSQTQYKYNAGDTVVGKNAKYVCKAEGSFSFLIQIDNIKNKDTTDNMYYYDGRLFRELDGVKAVNKYDQRDLYDIVELIFTKNELKILKKNQLSIIIYFTTDNKGITNEVSFKFIKSAPVFSTFNPDRFYEFEKKLKKVLKVSIDKSHQNVRNPKWIESIRFDEIP